MILFVTNLSYFLLQQLSKERNRLQKYINFLIYTRVFLKKSFFIRILFGKQNHYIFSIQISTYDKSVLVNQYGSRNGIDSI